MANNEKSIFALSSPWGISGISVIRVSGEECRNLANHLCSIQNPKPRYIYNCNLKDKQQNIIDNIMLSYLKAPKSFTGEDMLELYTHGSIAIIKRVLTELKEFSNLEPAQPGEFLKRAYINKKISLIQAEGINRLIHSETEKQRIVSSNMSFNKTTFQCNKIIEELTYLVALIDATIEFSEEDEGIQMININNLFVKITEELSNHVKSIQTTKKIFNGMNVIVFGPPNVGKSSLFNLITNSDQSIITPKAGTTRDLINVSLDIDGHKINFTDTAGLRQTKDDIEIIGIKKTTRKIESEEKLMLVLSPDAFNNKNVKMLKDLYIKIKEKEIIVIFNKEDLEDFEVIQSKWLEALPFLKKLPFITTCCANVRDMHKIMIKLSKFVSNEFVKQVTMNDSNLFFTEYRHESHLKKCLKFLNSGYSLLGKVELCSEELRLALKEIEKIEGNVDKESKLDIIFNKFCIGK